MRTSENPHYEYFIDGTSANRLSPKFALTRFSEVRLQLVRSFEKSKKIEYGHSNSSGIHRHLVTYGQYPP
jgi:hypothetical protein